MVVVFVELGSGLYVDAVWVQLLLLLCCVSLFWRKLLEQQTFVRLGFECYLKPFICIYYLLMVWFCWPIDWERCYFHFWVVWLHSLVGWFKCIVELDGWTKYMSTVTRLSSFLLSLFLCRVLITSKLAWLMVGGVFFFMDDERIFVSHCPFLLDILFFNPI